MPGGRLPVGTGELEPVQAEIPDLFVSGSEVPPGSLIDVDVEVADLLAVGAMWENDPKWVNGLEAGFDRVTPELLLATLGPARVAPAASRSSLPLSLPASDTFLPPDWAPLKRSWTCASVAKRSLPLAAGIPGNWLVCM